MSTEEWVWRCAQRLRQQWPTLAIADLEETAEQLSRVVRWRTMPPEKAAVEWLRQGVLDVA